MNMPTQGLLMLLLILNSGVLKSGSPTHLLLDWKTQASGAGNRCAFNNDFSFGFSNVVSTKPFWCQMQGGSTKQLRPTLIVVPEQNKREGQRKEGGDAKVGSYR